MLQDSHPQQQQQQQGVRPEVFPTYDDDYDEMYSGASSSQRQQPPDLRECSRAFFRKFDEGSSVEWDGDLGRSDTVTKALSNRSLKVAGTGLGLGALSFLLDIVFSRLMANSISDVFSFAGNWIISLGGLLGEAPQGLGEMTGVGLTLMLLVPCVSFAACVIAALGIWYGYSDYKMLRYKARQGHPAIEQGKKRSWIAIAMGIAGIILVII